MTTFKKSSGRHIKSNPNNFYLLVSYSPDFDLHFETVYSAVISKNKVVYASLCSDVCEARCECEKGYARSYKGHCVLKGECLVTDGAIWNPIPVTNHYPCCEEMLAYFNIFHQFPGDLTASLVQNGYSTLYNRPTFRRVLKLVKAKPFLTGRD